LHVAATIRYNNQKNMATIYLLYTSVWYIFRTTIGKTWWQYTSLPSLDLWWLGLQRKLETSEPLEIESSVLSRLMTKLNKKRAETGPPLVVGLKIVSWKFTRHKYHSYSTSYVMWHLDAQLPK
jgi:hypothetical protein